MNTLEHAINSFLFHCEFERRLNEKTIKAYKIDLNQMKMELGGPDCNILLKEIDKHALRPYIQWLAQFKPKTMKRKVAAAKAMFNYLEFEEVIPVSPFRKMRVRIKEPRVLPVSMTKREIEKLLRYAYEQKESARSRTIHAYQTLIRDIAVLELLFATGIRVSELCSLAPHHIDIQSGLVKVYGKGQKERLIHFGNQEVKAALRAYKGNLSSINNQSTFFINRLGNALSPQSVRFMVRKYAHGAKLEKHITPHTFRHTFATLLLEEDVDIKYIQSFLGHSSIMTTQIYTHVNKAKQKRILIGKHPRKRMVLNELQQPDLLS